MLRGNEQESVVCINEIMYSTSGDQHKGCLGRLSTKNDTYVNKCHANIIYYVDLFFKVINLII